MKRLLFSIAVVLICSAVDVQGFLPLDPEHIGIAFDTSALKNQYTFSGRSDIPDYSAIEVNGPRSLQQLFPTFQKLSFIRLSLNEDARLQGTDKLSTYVFYTECHIIRLEGKDLIHPFDYFW